MRTADDGSLQREVNIDDYLREMLREVHHLQRPPIDHRLPDVIRSLIRNTDPALLQTNAARLSTVVSQYNIVKRIINDIERPLFEMKLATIEQVMVIYCGMGDFPVNYVKVSWTGLLHRIK